MIIDDLCNVRKYYSIVPELNDVIEFLEIVENKPAGSYKHKVYIANVQEGMTTDISHSLLEAHRLYIDVQVLLSGKEGMGWKDTNHLTPSIPYDREKDVEFFSGKAIDMILNEGMFYICFPTDAHRCKGFSPDANMCRKICFKIPYDKTRYEK